MNKNNCFCSPMPCSGCGVCYAICPVTAISYTLNENGFYEAKVDEKKCISCGKCKKVCPKYIQDNKQLDINTFAVYSFVHKNLQILAGSSSGAAAWALAQLAIGQCYQVVGVEYDYQTNTAQAILATTLEQLEKLKGSKYLQANTQFYKDLLKRRGKFMVFGTPCQLSGLAQAAIQQGRRDDFLFVDCFCHGVPSYHVWHKFLLHIGVAHPTRITFRSKQGGWHNFCMRVENGRKVYCADARSNPFYHLFFSDLLLNEACYTCRAKTNTYVDIRLGDLWGADYDLTETGVSLVLPLSERGQVWVKKLAGEGVLRDIRYLREKIVRSQSAFRQTPCNFTRRKALLTTFNRESFSCAFAQYRAGMSLKEKMRVGLKSIFSPIIMKYLRFAVHRLKGY